MKKLYLVGFTLIFLGQAFAQNCDREAETLIYGLLGYKLKGISHLPKQYKIRKKYDLIRAQLTQQTNENCDESCRDDIYKKIDLLDKQEAQELEDSLSTAFEDPDYCKGEYLVPFNDVLQVKKQMCHQWDAKRFQEDVGDLKSLVRDGSDLCPSSQNLQAAFDKVLPSNPLNLPAYKACEIVQKIMRQEIVKCPEYSASSKVVKTNDSNSCEIAGPDGVCPGAPKPASSPQLWSVEETEKIRERKKKFKEATAR